MDISIKRGEIWLVDLYGSIGSEQNGVRPCLIVQNSRGNQFAPTTQIIPISSSMSKKKLPTHVYLDAAKHGLDRSSTAFAEQAKTIDKNRLICKITELDADTMKEVDKALMISFSLLPA